MEIFNPPYFTQSKNSFQGKLKTLFLLISLIIFSQTSVFSQVSLEGSWGVTFPVFGGERLDSEVNKGHDPVGGAQELVDELPMVGHVITNLSYFANSHYFPMSANTNVNVAKEIHPSLVPSAANDEMIFDVLNIFKKSGKKIILYISTNYLDRATPEVQAAWKAYYTANFGGDEYAAYKDLVRGFLNNVKDYADGYWFDTATALMSDGNYSDFVNMFKEVDPTALMAASNGDYLKIDGSDALVDSDGVDDENPRDYKIIMWETSSGLTDFTHGHITPLGSGAPPNSWGYEEFTIPDMVETPVYVNSGGEVLKHGWFPMRAQWHASGADLIFNTEEAYRFTRRITDAGATMTFASTVQYTASSTERGYIMRDEMAILKEVNRRLQMSPQMDYVPYTRPAGAKLVGETAPNYHQIIDFPALPVKDADAADFIPWAKASSGIGVTLTSSNPSVATIVNGKIRIQGTGTSNITASQAGNSTFAAATSATRVLTVSGNGTKQDQTITFPAFPTTRVGDPDLDPGVTASSGLAVNYISGNSNVATIVNGKIRIVGEGRSNITASQGGNATYNAATNVSRVLTVLEGVVVVKQDQTITFPGFPTTRVGDADLDPGVTASSGLAVTYISGNTNVATIVNGKIRIVGAGRTNITTSQAGNATYNAAANVSRVLTVLEAEVVKQDQVIDFPSFPTVSEGDADFAPDVSASSGLALTYISGNTNVATIVNGKIHIVGAGKSYITASQGGNAAYNAAPDRSRVLTVVASTIGATRIVHITKRNASGFAIDGNWGGVDGQNIYLYGQNSNNKNQQWLEIDRGNGYYSYQKIGTDFCIDGNNGGANNQNVYLYTCIENNQNQHWQKVDVGGGAFKLIKRNAPGFALNGGSGGSNTQNVSLWNAESTSQNLHWIITPVASAKNLDETDEVLIYPNPIVSSATIINSANSIINVYDINTKLILSQTISSESETLDFSLLTATGAYYAEIIGEGKRTLIKLIK